MGNVLGNLDGTIGDTTPTTARFTKAEASEGLIGALTGNVTGNVTGDVTGNLMGDVTGNVTGALTGNADTATALAADVTFTISGDASAEAQTFNGSGNVDIPITVTGGNATTADAWSTARSITLTGDVTGSVNIDGSGNVSLATTLQSEATVEQSVGSAARWTTSRTLEATGDVTGSIAGVDGSGDISLPLSYSANITAINNITPSNSTFLVGNGTTWVSESGSTVRASLGLGSAATQASTAFATAAQGALAASALQSVPSEYDTRTVADTRYATQSQGALADSAVQPSEALDTGSGTLTVNGVVFSVSSGRVIISSGGVNLFSINTTNGDVVARGNITANGAP